jgi:hypothetical protein
MMHLLLIAALPSLEGTWARLESTAATAKVPVLGEVESKTTALALFSIERDGSSHRITHQRVCSLETETLGGLVETRYPRAFLEAVSGLTRPIRLTRDERGLVYSEPKHARVVGATIDRTEALPSDAADPRVIDADGDGRPGVTVEVRGPIDGSIWVVHRDLSELRGRFAAEDRIAGEIRWKSEQSILGATHDLLAKPPSQKPKPGRFWMRKVPAATTCREVSEQREMLFDQR